jgi:amidase
MPLEGTKSKAALRVAVCADPTGDGVDSEVAQAIDSAAGILGDNGYVVDEAIPPDVPEIARKWGAMISTEIQTMIEPAIERHGSSDVRRSLDFFIRQYGVLDLNDYMRTFADRNRLIRRWMAFLEQYPLVLVPVSLEPVMGVGDDLVGFERMGEILRAQQMLVAVNFLGLPAVAIPVGLAGNVPIGVQIIASRYREDLCLDAASVIEEAVGVLVPRRWDADDSQ